MKNNKVYLIGAGPGKADLITVRGLNILRQADVVIYDYLVDTQILSEAKEGAELICCDTLKGRRYSNGFFKDDEKINQLLIKKVKEGKRVVRLKNGDTGIFSRVSGELEALIKENIRFEIVPGVTGASGASAFSGIPLTDRRFASSCIFVTGHEDPAKIESLLDWQSIASQGTIVLYMAVENLTEIVKNLIDSSKSPLTPVAVIQNASLITQKVIKGNLEDIVKKAKHENIKPPALIIIGEVVKLEKNFNWLKKNKRILFTGLSQERFFLKENYFHIPLIKIEPLEDYEELDSFLGKIGEFDWIVFTSRYGVEYFFKRLNHLGFDSRLLKDIKIAVIGNSTKTRLLDFGVIADLMPVKESSEGLLEAFKKENLKDKKIFLPRSDIADKGLTAGLELLGARVTSCVSYKNRMPEDLPDLNLSFFDEIMFTSPSTVRNFRKRYGKIPEEIKIRCIGEVTLKEAERCQLLG